MLTLESKSAAETVVLVSWFTLASIPNALAKRVQRHCFVARSTLGLRFQSSGELMTTLEGINTNEQTDVPSQITDRIGRSRGMW